ncbi:MAG TPA: type II CAAX endopeptidase family protein [Nocardioides sp.]
MLLLAFAGYLTAVFASAVAASVAAGIGGDAEGLVVLLPSQVAFWAVLIGTVVIARRGGMLGGLTDRSALRFRRIDLPIGAVVGVATQLLLVPAIYLPFRSFIDLDSLSEPAEDLVGGAHGIGLIALAVALVVVAPIVEELFFRGLLLEAMALRWGGAWAVAGSSVFFGATHFQPLQFPALTLAGAVFAIAALRARRLGPAVTTHAAFNATTFTTLVLSS